MPIRRWGERDQQVSYREPSPSTTRNVGLNNVQGEGLSGEP
jgi:hypothetical protein